MDGIQAGIHRKIGVGVVTKAAAVDDSVMAMPDAAALDFASEEHRGCRHTGLPRKLFRA
jgi:hypothetical protein